VPLQAGHFISATGSLCLSFFIGYIPPYIGALRPLG
jgi:hypothetical protein